jgi:hypothetical protein
MNSQGATSQKTAFFRVTAVKTSNPRRGKNVRIDMCLENSSAVTAIFGFRMPRVNGDYRLRVEHCSGVNTFLPGILRTCPNIWTNSPVANSKTQTAHATRFSGYIYVSSTNKYLQTKIYRSQIYI